MITIVDVIGVNLNLIFVCNAGSSSKCASLGLSLRSISLLNECSFINNITAKLMCNVLTEEHMAYLMALNILLFLIDVHHLSIRKTASLYNKVISYDGYRYTNCCGLYLLAISLLLTSSLSNERTRIAG